MEETKPQDWCSHQKLSTQKLLSQLQKKELNSSLARLVSFVIMMLCLWQGLTSYPLVLIGALLAGIIFYYTVRVHLSIRDQIFFCRNQIHAIEQTEKSLTTQHYIPINGHEQETCFYSDKMHWPLSNQECDDLDYYSEEAGLFGKINRTYTLAGRAHLAGLMRSTLLKVEDIENRVKAYQILEKKPETLHLLSGTAKSFDEIDNQFQEINLALKTPIQIPRFLKNIHYTYLPLLLGVLILGILEIIPQRYFISICLMALISNIILAKKIESYIFPCIKKWLHISSLLNYTELYLKQTQKFNLAETALSDLQEKTNQLLQSGQLEQLKKCVGMIRLRFSGIIHLIIDTFLFWDLICAKKLQKLLSTDHTFNKLEDIIGLWEAHCSMALANFINAEGTFAKVTEEKQLLIEDGFHPLLSKQNCVANSIQLNANSRSWVISGSNMSGKSTFLRMVGIQVVFALIGLKTHSKKTITCPLRLMTDLRIRDNLLKNESYFLAEVRQLKKMITESTNQPILLGIIDEPYRGTNSEERIAASVEVLRYLLSSGGFFLTATHDKEVTELSDKMEGVTNHHFREELSEKDISFDYLIRDGIATTRNAIRVLEKEGYPDIIIKNADQKVKTSRF